MKTLAFISCLLLSNLLHSQIADYFEGNPKWSLTRSYTPSDIYECDTTINYTYYIDGDTLINNLNYKILMKKSETIVHNGNPDFCNFTIIDDMPYFLIRQSNDSIFYINSQGEDALMVSYNVSVEGTFSGSIGIFSGYTVNYIDTVIIDGEVRRRYHEDTSFNSLWHSYIIEGLGHFHVGQGEFVTNWLGFNEMFTFVYLKCFSMNDNVQWQHPDWGNSDCDFQENLNISEPMESSILPIIPNPASDLIHVININKGDLFSIHSVSGKKMFVENYNGESINIESLKPGTYFLHHERGIQKFVKL